MDSILEKLAECSQRQQPVCLCVVVDAKGAFPGTLAAKCLFFLMEPRWALWEAEVWRRL
jgi:hypothetical protein